MFGLIWHIRNVDKSDSFFHADHHTVIIKPAYIITLHIVPVKLYFRYLDLITLGQNAFISFCGYYETHYAKMPFVTNETLPRSGNAN